MLATNNARIVHSAYNLLKHNNISDDVIINTLLEILKLKKIENDSLFNSLLTEFKTDNNELNCIAIVELIGLTHQKKKEKIEVSNTSERKHHGIYYTDYSIAELITKETLALYDNGVDLSKLSFLEPCSGIGIFAIAYLDTIFKTNTFNLHNAQKIINNMFFADIDAEAISLLKIVLPIYIKRRYGIDIKIPSKNTYVGDSLFNIEKEQIQKNCLKDIFSKEEGFDIVLTNPPYKLLKANSNKYKSTDGYKKQINLILSFIRKNKTYIYNTGTLNLYKLFIEEILEKLTKADSKIGLLIPSTLLSDRHSFELRNRILNKYSLSTIYTIPEKNDFFIDITQAFCFFSINKAKSSEELKIKSNVSNVNKFTSSSVTVKKSWIKLISTLQEIVSTDKLGWNILSKIHRHNKIKEIPSIANLRGELDISLDKKYITEKKTNYHLLRGNGIKEFVFIQDRFYVNNNFLQKLNGKGHFLLSDRIVCQQISNINLTKRLKFSKVPSNIVLGNSCNFISLNNDSLFTKDISLDYLLGVLNSFLLNWRFQLTNSNNHIGNYELDELPLAMPNKKQKKQIEIMISQLLKKPENTEIKAKLNGIIFDIYGLNKEESLYILDKYKKNEAAYILLKDINAL